MRLRSVCGLLVPVWPPHNTCVCPPSPPPRPGLKHLSAPRLSVVRRGVGVWKETHVPDVLSWMQVWGTGRPVHCINAFIALDPLTHFSHMGPGIVMHQREPRAHCVRLWPRSGSEDLIPWYLAAVKVTLACTRRAVKPSKEIPKPLLTHRQAGHAG